MQKQINTINLHLNTFQYPKRSVEEIEAKPVESAVCNGKSKSEYGKVNVLKCSYLKIENGFMKLIQKAIKIYEISLKEIE